MLDDEYEPIVKSKTKNKKFSFTTHFEKRKQRKYQINLYKIPISKYPSNNFDEFFEEWNWTSEIFENIELYEFIFSDLYKNITNENNVYFKALGNVAKELYKILKKGDF